MAISTVRREIVLATGTFRIVGSPRGIRAEIHTDTALGPIAATFFIAPSPELRRGVADRIAEARRRLHAPGGPEATAGIFDDIGHAVASVARGASSATQAAVHTVEQTALGAAEGIIHAAKTAASTAPDQIGPYPHTIPATLPH